MTAPSTTGRVVDVTGMARGFGKTEAEYLHITVRVDLDSPIDVGERVIITGEVDR